jgi:hypothetical protein
MTEWFPNLYGDTRALNLPWGGRCIRECLHLPLAEWIGNDAKPQIGKGIAEST